MFILRCFWNIAILHLTTLPTWERLPCGHLRLSPSNSKTLGKASFAKEAWKSANLCGCPWIQGYYQNIFARPETIQYHHRTVTTVKCDVSEKESVTTTFFAHLHQRLLSSLFWSCCCCGRRRTPSRQRSCRCCCNSGQTSPVQCNKFETIKIVYYM